MTPADIPKLLKLIRDLVLVRLVIVTDVTLTILRQSVDGSGFPEAMRRAIRALLDRGVAFVFCSGDSRVILKQQLTDHLDCGPASIHVLSGSGADMFADEPIDGGRRHRTLFQMSPLPAKVLSDLLDRALTVFHRVLGHPVHLSAAERHSLLSLVGDRINVGDRIPVIQEEALLECRPMKGFTLFFRQSGRAAGWALRLLTALAEDPQLQQLCIAARLTHSPGPNYYDAALSTKYQAAEMFFTHTLEGRELATRRTIALGDSMNDRPLMQYFRGVDAIRAFVGAESEFELVTGGGLRSVFLGGNLAGSILLFERLLRL